jgi:hypothetical protein
MEVRAIKYIIFFMALYLCSCTKDTGSKDYFLFQNGKASIFPIISTRYRFKNYIIYKIGVSRDLTLYNGLLNGGYFAVRKNTIYDIALDSACSDDYKNKDYIIDDTADFAQKLKNVDCDIIIRPLFSTNYSIGDTVSQIVKEYNYSILKTKFFDSSINDTIYIFENKTNINKYSGFVFCYTKGIVGIYNIKKDSVGKSIILDKMAGKDYEEKIKEIYPLVMINRIDSFETFFKNVDLDNITELLKY